MRLPLPAFLFPAVIVVVVAGGGSRALFIALKVFGSEGEGAGSAPVRWGHCFARSLMWQIIGASPSRHVQALPVFYASCPGPASHGSESVKVVEYGENGRVVI